MDVKDLQKERARVIVKIRDAIQKELDEFNRRTGLSLESINISMENVTAYTDETPKYIIGTVDCRIAV